MFNSRYSVYDVLVFLHLMNNSSSAGFRLIQCFKIWKRKSMMWMLKLETATNCLTGELLLYNLLPLWPFLNSLISFYTPCHILPSSCKSYFLLWKHKFLVQILVVHSVHLPILDNVTFIILDMHMLSEPEMGQHAYIVKLW